VRLAPGVFGIYRVATRTDVFDRPAVEGVAKHLSVRIGRVVALLYDNTCGIRAGVLYTSGRRSQEFGDGDAWWFPYGEDGELVLPGPRFRISELRPDTEYECVFSAIDAGLEAVEAGPAVNAVLVKRAFCYGELGYLAETAGLAANKSIRGY